MCTFFPRICSPQALLSSGAQSTRTHPWFLSDPRLHPRGSVGGIGWSSQRGIQVHFPTVHGWPPSSRGPGSQVYCPGRGALGALPGSAAPQMTGCELPAAWGGRLGAMSHRLGSRVQARTAPLTQAAGGGGGGVGRCCCQGNSGFSPGLVGQPHPGQPPQTWGWGKSPSERSMHPVPFTRGARAYTWAWPLVGQGQPFLALGSRWAPG